MRVAVALLALFCAACGSIAPVAAPSASPGLTPIPTASPLGIADLKFKLVDSIGKPAFCDPDLYPVARPESELASALAAFPSIQADAATFAAIVNHERLIPRGSPTPRSSSCTAPGNCSVRSPSHRPRARTRSSTEPSLAPALRTRWSRAPSALTVRSMSRAASRRARRIAPSALPDQR